MSSILCCCHEVEDDVEIESRRYCRPSCLAFVGSIGVEAVIHACGEKIGGRSGQGVGIIREALRVAPALVAGHSARGECYSTSDCVGWPDCGGSIEGNWECAEAKSES